jgi:hypothetical protein
LKSWFIVDVLTVGIEWLRIIMEMMLSNTSGSLVESVKSSTEAAQLIRMMRIARIVRMFRLLRVLKLKKLLHTFYDQVLGYMEWIQLLLQILQMLMMVLVLIHTVGCMWYGFSVNLIGSTDMTWVEYYLVGKDGEFTPDAHDDGFKYHYLTALHWALAQVSPGNTDIMPMNWKERAMNIFVLCLTLIIFSSFISSMTVAVTRLRNLHSADEKRHAMLRKYFRDHGVPPDLAIRVQSFLEEKMEAHSCKTQEKEVDLLHHLTKGLYHEILRVSQEPILRKYPVLRQLNSSEPAKDLMGMICAEACSQKVVGPGEKVYVVDEVSRGMYFLNKGAFELREYRDDDVEIFSVCAPDAKATDLRLSKIVKADPKLKSKSSKIHNVVPQTTTVAWLSEFSLFWHRTHDTMLIGESYCEVLQVSRQAFSAVVRQFPTLHDVLMDANESRHEHAELMMGSDVSVGDWIRPLSCYKQNPQGWMGVVPTEVLQRMKSQNMGADDAAASRHATKAQSWAPMKGSLFEGSAPGA